MEAFEDKYDQQLFYIEVCKMNNNKNDSSQEKEKSINNKM